MANGTYEVMKLSEDSWRIEDNGVRAFLFTGEKRALLVDTGFGTGNIREATEGLTQKPIMLVNTHADGDHIGCNALFDQAYMHPSEFPYYFETAPANAVAMPLWEGDSIDLGGRAFDVILIPGHTPGSIALLDRDNRLLIAGDSISETPIFMFGKARSIAAYIESMKKLLMIREGFDTVYPSHGPFPISGDLIDKLIEGAGRVARGEVPGQAPPFDIPAKMYLTNGVGFFYD